MSDDRSNLRLVGLTSLQWANVKSSGSFPATAASFHTIGNIVPGSAVLAIDQPPETIIECEDKSQPDLILQQDPAYHLEFALRDMGTKSLLLGLGGSATATLWRASTTANVVREKAFLAKSQEIGGKKFTIRIPRASMKVGGDLKFSKTETGTLAFSCRVLTPNSTTQIPPCTIAQT